MAEPFEVNTEADGGTTLTPNFDTGGPTPESIGLLPDVTQALGPRPQLPLPAPPPPPPSPTQDPRQQLLAIAALGLAAGMGPSAGGGGAFRGFLQGQQFLQHDQLSRYQLQVAEHDKQQQLLAQQARLAQTEFDKRAANIKQTLINFKTATEKVGSKEEYDRMADAYGAALQQYGARNIDANWLRSNIPYMKPSEAKTAKSAFDAWLKNPTNKKLLDENPEAAFKSVVSVDLNGDGVVEHVPLPVLADKAGVGFATDQSGQILTAPRGVAGTSAFDVLLNARLEKFRAENRREPTPKEKEQLVAKTIDDAKDRQPPQDHFGFMQTFNGDGTPGPVMRTNSRAGTMTPMTVPGGGSLKPPPAAVLTEDRAKKGALNTLDQLDQAIDAAADKLGPGRGRFSNFEQMIGSADPTIQALGVKMKAAKMQVDHAVTGSVRAGASPMLIKQWDNILANNITPEGLHAGVKAMREILTGGAASGSRFTIIEKGPQ